MRGCALRRGHAGTLARARQPACSSATPVRADSFSPPILKRAAPVWRTHAGQRARMRPRPPGTPPSALENGRGRGEHGTRPWEPELSGAKAMRLGALEQEHGGVASVLGSAPLCPIPSPKACMRAGGLLEPRRPVMTEPPQAAGGRRAEGWALDLANKAFAVGFSRR